MFLTFSSLSPLFIAVQAGIEFITVIRLYHTSTDKATPSFIKLPPRLRNNRALPVYNYGDDDIEGITQERERI